MIWLHTWNNGQCQLITYMKSWPLWIYIMNSGWPYDVSTLIPFIYNTYTWLNRDVDRNSRRFCTSINVMHTINDWHHDLNNHNADFVLSTEIQQASWNATVFLAQWHIVNEHQYSLVWQDEALLIPIMYYGVVVNEGCCGVLNGHPRLVYCELQDQHWQQLQLQPPQGWGMGIQNHSFPQGSQQNHKVVSLNLR